uniref:Uncharacterized protein n=1 Tax=Amphimedon queenslandica TaxID=400682 RepID=A0A1X7UFV7_AMPQE
MKEQIKPQTGFHHQTKLKPRGSVAVVARVFCEIFVHVCILYLIFIDHRLIKIH